MTLSADHLEPAGLTDRVTALERVVEAYRVEGRGASLAVVSDPFGGRAALADAVCEQLDGAVERRRLEAVVPPDDVPDPTDAEPLVLEDAQYLHTRRIGGFEPLDRFTDRLARADGLVVTTWNRYAWRYLGAVRDLDRPFTRVVDVPPLDAAGLRAVAADWFGPERPAFVDRGSAGRVRSFSLETASIDLPGGRSVAVPYPSPNPAWLAAWNRAVDDRSVETVVFEKLNRLAGGNPGVAAAIWERSYSDGEIAPGDLDALSLDRSLADDEALLLWAVVALEAVDGDVLAELPGVGRLHATLEPLRADGLVTVDAGRVSIRAEAVPAAVAALDRKGMLW